MDPDEQLIVLLVHRHAHPARIGRPARRVESVVDEVAEQRDQIFAVNRAARHDGVITYAKFDPAF